MSFLVAVVLAAGFSGVNFTADAGIISSIKASAVNNYSDFYKIMQSTVQTKKASVTVKIKDYNSKTYSIDGVIKKIQNNNSKLNYIVSRYSYGGYNSGRYSTITILLGYVSSDKVANNYNDFYNYIRTAAQGKKSFITIKLNKYTSSIYDTNKIWSKLKSEKFNGYSVAQCGWRRIIGPDSSNILMTVSLTYNSNSTDTSIDDIITGNWGNTVNNQQSNKRIVVRTYAELYNAIKTGLTNVANVNLRIDNNSMNSNSYVLNTVNKVVEDNPDLRIFTRYYSQSIGNDFTVSFDFSFSRDKILQMRKSVDDKVKYIVAHNTNSKMNEYQKELALHDYVVNHTKYDNSNYVRGTIPEEDYTAYGVLVNGKAVCEGYANAMYKLLKAAGIENRVVTGYAGGEGHAWNIVKVGGAYYHLDSTWDDPVTSSGANVLSHKYFNLIDSQISRDHSWDSSKYPKCTSTKYKYLGR